MTIRHVLLAALAATTPAWMLNACSDESVNAGATATGSTASSVPSSSAGSASGGAGVGGAGVGGAGVGPSSATGVGGSGCTGSTQCTDCIDNDGDGQIDAWDVECVGPLDNDEGSFATGIPGDNSDPCKQDCFFDGNSGSGNDGCDWDLACDPKNPGAPECPYDPNKNNCPVSQSQKCIDECFGFTPNGCDCFGCCAVTLADKSTVTILLGAGCTDETATDPNICKPCTPVADCFNPCDTCEYCLGKTELPPECSPPDGGTPGSGGANAGAGGGGSGCLSCSPTTPCPPAQYCLTGCCIPEVR